MTGRLIFLYNSVDLSVIRELHDLAMEDELESGLQPWLDKPNNRQRDAATLGAHADVDEQICAAIGDAEAILYFMGSLGPGPYQQNVEGPRVGEAVAARKASGRPLRILVVQLGGARSEDDLPAWAKRSLIIEGLGELRMPAMLWAEIRQRLRLPESETEDDSADAKPSPEERRLDAAVRGLRGSIDNQRPGLTIFIGPYSFAGGGNESIGPSKMTELLLEEIGIPAGSLGPILPWPSEAAQWASLAMQRLDIIKIFRRGLAGLGQKPPKLADSIGFLAARWTLLPGASKGNALVLLTTRVDLAIESVLCRLYGVPFTRILPTLNEATESKYHSRLVEHWPPNPNWIPNPSDPYPPDGVVPDESVTRKTFRGLEKSPLEGAKPVILVKLCGSLEVTESLILTAQDFFKHANKLHGLSSAILRLALQESPQLLVGRGFASPLAQLIRTFVLKRRKSETSSRVWVMPALPIEDEEDMLCQLELRLLVENQDRFRDAIDASEIHRAQQHIFVRRLAEII